jgi:Gpi18-like mannosyltransferase
VLKVVGDRPRRWAARAPLVQWGVAALAVFSIAAASAPDSPSGKFTGFVAGALLIGLVGYALFDYLRPLIHQPDSGLLRTILVLAVLAAAKLAVMPLFPGFGPDVGSYQSWAAQIASLGPAHTYQEGYFLDYPPGYLYALWVAGLVAQAVGASGDFYRIIIESPAIVADFALAILMYAFVRRGSKPAMAFIAMLMVALNPPLLFDTVVWGQSDSVLTFVTLLSIAAILSEQYEISWGLAAIAVLVKPQGLMMLPVLGVWTLLEAGFATWVSSGVALIAVAIVGIAPFQIGHEWDWILKLYTSTAAYYHETSVNAFNLIALLGGLRAPDSDTFGGISFFALGMSLLAPLYAFVAWILWRCRTPTRLLYASFIAIFGFFMVAPRMHERYLYPAIVLAVPLALEAPEMLAVFVVLSITCLINLAYILHTLNTVVFLNGRDGFAMVTSALNVIALGAAVHYGVTRLESGGDSPSVFDSLFRKFAAATPPDEYTEDDAVAPPWIATDTIVISALLIVAAVTRFWHLGHPAEIVFDEVHFVAQGRHYLHGESFLDPHPPLAKLIIATGILIFGDHPWSWRVGNATIGTALVGITYLLARRMMGSRLTGAIAGAIILCDGMYLVDSRFAVIDIVYLTCAAVAYLFFFKFAQTPDACGRRRILPWIGLALGLCLASKLYIPAITFLLVTGFLLYVLAKERPETAPKAAEPSKAPEPPKAAAKGSKSRSAPPRIQSALRNEVELFDRTGSIFVALTCIALVVVLSIVGETFARIVVIVVAVLALRFAENIWRASSSSSGMPAWRMPSMASLREPASVGAIAIVGSVAAIAYIAVFLPHYWFGWWGGIEDLFYYYNDIVWYEKSVASATHPYASPWWSWPLMLRPVAYWQSFPKQGDVQTIWGGGNPLLWWGALTAITITAVKAVERPTLTRSFLVIGYLSYLVIWIWIGRTLFLYHYMGSIYFGYLALAILLADCFKERAEPWEHLALLLTMTPVFFLSMGPQWSWPLFVVAVGVYLVLLVQTHYAGRYVACVFALGALILSVYYFPIWVGMPISREGYYARMWLQESGLRSWI